MLIAFQWKAEEKAKEKIVSRQTFVVICAALMAYTRTYIF